MGIGADDAGRLTGDSRVMDRVTHGMAAMRSAAFSTEEEK
jgi:hypothetical protein